MNRVVVGCVAAALSGCFSQPRQPEPAVYDLGIVAGNKVVQSSVSAEPAVVRVRVSAPSWLDNTAMHYRLLYEDELRMLTYAYARWAAPPAELLEQRLRQQLAERAAARPLGSATVYLLHVELEEFVQVFETPSLSFARVTVRVRLSGAATEDAAFSEQVAAPTPDAAGGVRALAAATGALSSRIIDWTAGARGDKTAARLLRPPRIGAG